MRVYKGKRRGKRKNIYYLCFETELERRRIIMTALELEARKNALARKVLSITDARLLDEVEKSWRQAKKRFAKTAKKDDDLGPSTKEEILENMNEAFRDLRLEKDGVSTGKFRDAYKLLNEL